MASARDKLGPAKTPYPSLPPKLRRDEQIRALARRMLKQVPALDKVEYRPLVLNYCRMAWLCERAFMHLYSSNLVDKHNELRQSLNTYRCLVAELTRQRARTRRYPEHCRPARQASCRARLGGHARARFAENRYRAGRLSATIVLVFG
jgi:hypothetical protein